MSVEMTLDNADATARATSTPWAAVLCLALMCFLLVALEFMPVSLLTPIAADLGITDGQAGSAIAASGFFAVAASLFGNYLLRSLDRRKVVVLYSAILAASSVVVATAPGFAVFLIGRALVGVAIGGFWSLSTAILARISSKDDLPKAIAMIQGGTALAIVLAPPLGSILGELIGWRQTFLSTVPLALAAMAWELVVLPKMPPEESASARRMFGLLRSPVFALGMAGTGLAFFGMNALSIYLRPFLENITGLDIGPLSAVLFGLGLGGIAGTAVIGFVVRRKLAVALVGLPLGLAAIALLLIPLGPFALVAGALLVIWGLFNTPVPVVWNTWMAGVIPGDLEAGGGLQVALIQLSIAGGAFAGGVMFDSVGWWSAFLLAAGALTISALLALFASRRG